MLFPRRDPYRELPKFFLGLPMDGLEEWLAMDTPNGGSSAILGGSWWRSGTMLKARRNDSQRL
jgi:hypothetical protein